MFEIVVGTSVCTFNNPISVATHGVLAGPLGIATLGEITLRTVTTAGSGVVTVGRVGGGQFGNLTGIGSNPGAAYFADKFGRNEWYFREDPTDPLKGPMSFRQAEYLARKLSRDPEHSGLAEVCTFMGSRGGDPINSSPNPNLFVVYMYARGKRSLGGRTAQYHSDFGLPPTV